MIWLFSILLFIGPEAIADPKDLIGQIVLQHTLRVEEPDRDAMNNFLGQIEKVNQRVRYPSDLSGCVLDEEARTAGRELPVFLVDHLPPHLKNDYFACASYINNLGAYGKKGEIVAEILRQGRETKYAKLFSDLPTADMPQLCPGFSGFNEEEKTHFWVWFFMALASDESSCGKCKRLDCRSPGVNRRDPDEVGEFQLEETESFRRKKAGRPSPDCFPPENRIAEFNNNVTCALAIFSREADLGWNLFGARRYWQKLNKSEGHVIDMVKGYKLCRVGEN